MPPDKSPRDTIIYTTACLFVLAAVTSTQALGKSPGDREIVPILKELKSAPESPDPWLRLAHIAYRQGAYAGALRLANISVKKFDSAFSSTNTRNYRATQAVSRNAIEDLAAMAAAAETRSEIRGEENYLLGLAIPKYGTVLASQLEKYLADKFARKKLTNSTIVLVAGKRTPNSSDRYKEILQQRKKLFADRGMSDAASMVTAELKSFHEEKSLYEDATERAKSDIRHLVEFVELNGHNRFVGLARSKLAALALNQTTPIATQSDNTEVGLTGGLIKGIAEFIDDHPVASALIAGSIAYMATREPSPSHTYSSGSSSPELHIGKWRDWRKHSPLTGGQHREAWIQCPNALSFQVEEHISDSGKHWFQRDAGAVLLPKHHESLSRFLEVECGEGSGLFDHDRN